MILKYETETVKIPVMAGMQMVNGKTINYKMKIVGHFLHTYSIHDDGDRQLTSSKKIKRKLKY